MTLIATGGFHTYPAIFGDLAVADAGRDDRSAGPLAGREHSTDAMSSSPSTTLGPTQKVVLLGDHCVIAWSGSAAVAATTIRELRAMASGAPLSISVVNAHLAHLDPAVKDQVSFVGWVKEGDVFHQFWYRADVAKSVMFGRISAGGSGGTAFVKLASRVSATTWNVLGGAPEDLDRAISWMLSATSLLLQAELESRGRLLQFIASGYEIATFVGDRFAKVGDISFVFWVADVIDGRVELSGPELVLKQDYAGESLLLRVLRMRADGTGNDPAMVEESRHVVPPFAGASTVDQASGITWPGMEATFTCHLIFVRSPGGVEVANRIEYSATRTPDSIRFISEDGRTNIAVSEQFCDELAQSISAGGV